MVDEHGDRTVHHATDLEHLLQDVAGGVLQVYDDDVRVDGDEAFQEVRHPGQDRDVGDPSRTQALLQDGGADGIVINHGDFDRSDEHRASSAAPIKLASLAPPTRNRATPSRRRNPLGTKLA